MELAQLQNICTPYISVSPLLSGTYNWKLWLVAQLRFLPFHVKLSKEKKMAVINWSIICKPKQNNPKNENLHGEAPKGNEHVQIHKGRWPASSPVLEHSLVETLATVKTENCRLYTGGKEKLNMSNRPEFWCGKRNENFKYYTLICILNPWK